MKNLITLAAMLFFSCVATLMAQNPVATVPQPTVVVARRSFINQTGDIPPTTVFQPARKGLYRVTIDIEQSNTAGGYGPEAFLSWTGDFASYQTQMPISSMVYSGSTAAASGEVAIRGAAGQPIQVSTTVNPNEQGTYNLYVVIEK